MAKQPRYALKLSRTQKAILSLIRHWEEGTDEWIEQHPTHPSLQAVKEYRQDGMDWQPNRMLREKFEREPTPTFRADMSRALRRLEQRGLVERFPMREDHPALTYRVKLTPRGRKTSQRLQGYQRQYFERRLRYLRDKELTKQRNVSRLSDER
jgi:DNA-binding HxlR family transcriptional regulator